MAETPVTGAMAEYRGTRYRIAFSDDDWVALCAEPGPEIPDALESGVSQIEWGRHRPWVRVPRSSLDGIVYLDVTGTLAGQTVSLIDDFGDGRIGVEFVGPPATAREIGMKGDQYMGWSAVVKADELRDIRVAETRRA